MATRICKLNSFHNFVGGKDNDNVFEEGVIYSVLNLSMINMVMNLLKKD